MPGDVLLSCERISRAYGGDPVFRDVSFTLHEGDHAGLVGPNGSGKSTLLRILAGLEEPDSGIRAARRGIRIGFVPQDPIFAPGRTVEQIVADGIADASQLDPNDMIGRVGRALARGGFDDPGQRSETLSGGWRKRLAIARALAGEPDVLLLDEPTNHLDVESILWLESLLASAPKAFVTVSHDRYFLENVARRMIELNKVFPDGLLQIGGSYADLLVARDQLLQSEAAYQETLANLVRREIEWLRRGPKARTTKSKARIDRAAQLIDDLGASRARSKTATAGIDFTASERKTKRLWSCRGLGKSLQGRPLLTDLDLVLSPGSRLGVIGPNGAGKTTLLRIVSGEIDPDEGTIEKADDLRVVYFDQNREEISPDISLKRALSPESDSVVFRGSNLHVVSWARRFLFRPEQLDVMVGRLSGGEKARVAIARLMLQPADLLILDEPTNDLDIPTLDVLEESLLDFPGAMIVVTHDRYMLDRLATSILALDGDGGTERFADFAQWSDARRSAGRKSRSNGSATSAKQAQSKGRRLSYHEQREWDAMEEAVLAAEAELEEATRATEDPVVATDAPELQRRFERLAAAEREVARLYARWAELEERKA